jgi:hypothetical protein
MQRLEVSGAVRLLVVVRRQRVKVGEVRPTRSSRAICCPRHSVRWGVETAETFGIRKSVLILFLAKPRSTPKQFSKTDAQKR